MSTKDAISGLMLQAQALAVEARGLRAMLTDDRATEAKRRADELRQTTERLMSGASAAEWLRLIAARRHDIEELHRALADNDQL